MIVVTVRSKLSGNYGQINRNLAFSCWEKTITSLKCDKEKNDFIKLSMSQLTFENIRRYRLFIV